MSVQLANRELAEQGVYSVNIGSSSTQIKGSVAFTLPNELVADKVHK